LTASLIIQFFRLCASQHNRENWFFCWTELGAKHVEIIQSLIVTCRLQGIDPTTYLIDVLQRVKTHPEDNMIELTPRVRKEKFGVDPLPSYPDKIGKDVVI
jgi:transposase